MAKRGGKGEGKKAKRSFANLQQEAVKQFRGIDPNDPGQWPLFPRLAAYLALIVIVIGVAWFAFIADKQSALESAKAQEETLKSDYIEKVTRAVHIDKLRVKQKEVAAYVKDLEGRLPNESQIDELVKDISAAGIQNGLEFNSLKPERPVNAEYYIEQPITMVATSPAYHNVAYFAQKLAELRRIVTITDIKLMPAQIGKDSPLQIVGEQLKIEATLKTYRYMTPDEQRLNQQGGQ